MRPPKGVLNNDEPQETHRCIDSPGGCLLFEHRRLRERRGRGRGIGQQPGTQPRRRKPSPGFIAAQSYHGVVAADASQNMSPTGSGGTEAGFLVLYAFSEAPPASLTDDEAFFSHQHDGKAPIARLEMSGTPVYVFEYPDTPDSRFMYSWLRHGILANFDGAARGPAERWLNRYLAAP